MSSHIRFHQAVGAVLSLHTAGLGVQARGDVLNGDFTRESRAVSRYLVRLWQEIGLDNPRRH